MPKGGSPRGASSGPPIGTSGRDIGARFIAANTHPDHDTIATFRRTNKAAFLEVLLRGRETGIETGILALGMVSIEGTKIDANASKIRSVRYDRATVRRETR